MDQNYYINKSRKIIDYFIGLIGSCLFGYALFFQGLFLGYIFPTTNVSYGPGPVRDFLIGFVPLLVFYLAMRFSLAAKRKFIIWGILTPYIILAILWALVFGYCMLYSFNY